jgi:hypothetical protein
MAKTYAKCTCCGTVNHVSEMVKTEMPNRGGRHAYMCSNCARQNRSYHTSNNVLQGKAKVNAVCVGIEFETSFSDEHARNIMFEYGFIPTHDCSLNSDGNARRYGYDGNTCEYVSGIMQGLNIASKFAVTAEKLISENHMSVNNSCGTHTHISVDSMKDEHGEKTYIGYIQRFYHSLFVPLSDAMKANPNATEKLFGRYFNSHYAKSINPDSYCGDRYNFINVVNNSNIEFRLNKFVSAKQYQNLIKMEVEMVKCIVTNFCEHFNDTEIDSRRYPNKTAYRKHKADVTAKKLVKLFEKYSANI